MNRTRFSFLLLVSLAFAGCIHAQSPDRSAGPSDRTAAAPGATLSPPGFTFSNASGNRKFAQVTVDSIDGCAIDLSVRVGKSFSLQTAGHAAEHFAASEGDDGKVIVDRLVATTDASGRLAVSMQPLTASQSELRASRIARIGARLDPSKPAPEASKLTEYDLASCGCCVLTCVRSDGRPFVWNFCGCGCADCSANGGSSCCNGS